MQDYKTSYRNRSVANEQSSVVWFISFGDLLTLLLCFFLVLTPWDRLSTPHKYQSAQQIEENRQTDSAFGTSFASKSRRVSKIVAEVPIFEAHDGFLDVLQTANWLQQYAQSKEAVEISLKVCVPARERQQTLEKLGRMVTEAGGASWAVAFEVHESCESTAFLVPVTERLVGVVRVSRV
jgi:hypothetical protein